MPDAPADGHQLAFDREKWAGEMSLRQRELEIKAIEADAKVKEQERQAEQLRFTQLEARRNRWTNPLVVAVFAAAVAAAGNAVVAWLNGTEQRTIEQIRADQGLILEAIKANGDPDKAAANLRFLAETALISNSERRAEILTFLNRRKPGEGPALPSSNSASSYVGQIVGAGRGVEFCQAAAQLPLTRQWRRGDPVKGNPSVKPGTAIATFDADGTYQDERSHCGIYESQNELGIVLLDQWFGHAVHQRLVGFGGTSAANNGDEYYVIN